jgi:hypothetical protein
MPISAIILGSSTMVCPLVFTITIGRFEDCKSWGYAKLIKNTRQENNRIFFMGIAIFVKLSYLHTVIF